MDALFLQSARSLATLDKSQDHKDLAATYRFQCIRSINNALSSESTWTSDSTISKVVIMGSDQVSMACPFMAHTTYMDIADYW